MSFFSKSKKSSPPPQPQPKKVLPPQANVNAAEEAMKEMRGRFRGKARNQTVYGGMLGTARPGSGQTMQKMLLGQ